MSTPIDHNTIALLVPHAGSMCLIDQVLEQNLDTIRCRAQIRASGHPLARNGEIPSTVAIEYAAQACAIHGALLEKSGQSRPGFLAKITSTKLDTRPLSPVDDPLMIFARRLSSTDQGCLYTFETSTPMRLLAAGTLMIAFTDTHPTPA